MHFYHKGLAFSKISQMKVLFCPLQIYTIPMLCLKSELQVKKKGTFLTAFGKDNGRIPSSGVQPQLNNVSVLISLRGIQDFLMYNTLI